MNRILIALLMLIVVSCVAPKSKLPTAIPDNRLSQTPLEIDENKTAIGDGGLISEQPCNAPCFFGIRIGETRLEQVIPTLEESGIVTCKQDVELRILCGNNILIGTNESTTFVDRIGYEPSNTIFLRDVIAKYGSPELVHVIPTGIPEAPTTDTLLFFDEWEMRIRLPTVDGMNYIVSGSSEVELVNYFDETLYNELRQNVYSQPWGGYATYQPKEDH